MNAREISMIHHLADMQKTVESGAAKIASIHPEMANTRNFAKLQADHAAVCELFSQTLELFIEELKRKG